jgi:hypothetical protein
MQRFRIYTLVDITRTQVFKENIDPIKKRQQDNFTTLHQTMEMRGNVYFDEDPYIENMIWNNQQEKTWVWDIYTEQDDLFLSKGDPTYFMKKDIKYVPFIDGCEETAKFDKCFFSDQNTRIEYVST